MKRFVIGCGLFLALMCAAWAADNTNAIPVLATKRGNFTNAIIRSVSAGYAIVIYDGGGQRIPVTDLPESVRKRYATNASQTNLTAATSPNGMSPAEYIEWQKVHAPELLLQQINSQIAVTQSQITLLQQKASDLANIGGNSQMPTYQSTVAPLTADVFLSQGTPHPITTAKPALQVYNDKLRDLQNLKEQLQQIILARQRAQFGSGN